jgi:hypothetical protein
VSLPARPRRGSTLRLAIGVALIVAALAITVYGFLRLGRVLEAGGYGTPAVRDALIILGLAGACISAGIALIIWDVSQRYSDE